jgi:hypothetical protein
MKKTNTIKMIMLMMAAGVFFVPRAAAQEAERAYIREFTGTVEVKEPGDSVWAAARAGQEIRRDTVISTGFKSTARIGVGNSIIIVRPLTRLSFAEIRNNQGNESVQLELHTGRVRANVSPPAGGSTDFTVRSPQATASVRGTSFDFDGANLNVDEGRVYVSGGDGVGAYVGAGHRAVSDPRTGRTMGGVELVRTDMAPPLPEAAAESAPPPAPLIGNGEVDLNLSLTINP